MTTPPTILAAHRRKRQPSGAPRWRPHAPHSPQRRAALPEDAEGAACSAPAWVVLLGGAVVEVASCKEDAESFAQQISNASNESQSPSFIEVVLDVDLAPVWVDEPQLSASPALAPSTPPTNGRP